MKTLESSPFLFSRKPSDRKPISDAYAAGDVASAVESTWTSAKDQIQSVVNNVVFPVIDVILGVLLFVKIATAYLEYRKHGTLEWTPIAIIFGGLLFSLTAPLYVWTIL